MNFKKSRIKGKKSTILKRVLLKQEPEFYSNSFILSSFINLCSNKGKVSKSEIIFYQAVKHYKLKHKLLIYKLLFDAIEKIKPAFIGKQIHKRIISEFGFVPQALQRTNYMQKYKIALRWLIKGIRAKNESFYLNLLHELLCLKNTEINRTVAFKKSKELIEVLSHPLNERYMRYNFTKSAMKD